MQTLCLNIDLLKRYQKPDMTNWYGRIDSTENYDAFRWHQWIQPMDLGQKQLFEKMPSQKIGIALLGFSSDEGVRRNQGRTGASKGPASIRKELRNLPCSFTQELKLYDAGNILCEDDDLETSQNALAAAVADLLTLGLFPIIMGGGHEVAYGNYKGLMLKNMTPGIVNFDAHFDIRPYHAQGSSGTMFRQIYDDLMHIHQPYHYFAIGIQKRGNTVDLFKTADKMGVHYLMAKDIGEGDCEDALEKFKNYIQHQEQLYMTICTDVFSSAFAPGVSATQPLGLNPERVLKFFKTAFRSGRVVLFDIAEVSPRFDNDNVTSNLAATFIFSAIHSIATLHHIAL